MKALTPARALPLVFLAAACASTSQQPQHNNGPLGQNGEMPNDGEVAAAYVRAIENDDMATLMSLYSDDAEIFVQDRLVSTGQEGARATHQYEMQVETEQYVVFSSSNAERFQMILEGSSEFYRLLGIDRFQQRVQLEVDNGQIVSLRSNYDDESMKALSMVFPRFVQWVSRNDPEAFQRIFQSGSTLVMDGPTGAELLGLARGFNAAQNG